MIPTQSTSELTVLLTQIINQYFMNLNSIIIIYDWPATGPDNLNYLWSLEDVQLSLLSIPIPTHWIRLTSKHNSIEFSELLHQNVELGCQGYITIVEDLDAFLSVKYEVQQFSTQRIQDKIFLFLSNSNINIEDFFTNPHLQLYPNHLMVVPAEQNTFDLFTQTFSGSDNVKPILVDKYFACNRSFARNTPLYWDKVLNLNGKVLTLASVTYIPYSITRIVPPGTGMFNELNSTEEKTVFYDGTEAKVVMEFCRLRNCTIVIKPHLDDHWGTIENGTADGPIGDVYYGDAELTIGCIYKWYAGIFDVTQPIAKSGITLLVPAAKPVSYALTPILPFDSYTWLYLCLVMHFSVLLYYYIRLYSETLSETDATRTFPASHRQSQNSFRNAYLEIIAILLQQSFKLSSSRLPVRIVIAVFLLSGITLENAYSGGLKSLLTIPRYLGKIETVHQFVETGFAWGAPQIAWVLSIQQAQAPDDLAIVHRFEVQPDNILYNKSFQQDYGIGVERLHAGSYSFGSYVQMKALKKQDMLKEDLYYEYTNGYAIRGWPLMGYFDKISMEVIQHGLFHHWEFETVNRYLNLKIENYLRQMATGYSEKSGPAVLLVAHIYGPLAILSIGVIIATVAIVGEHIYHHTRRGYQN